MDDYTVYRLRFKTQLHLGRPTGAAQTGSLGLENTEIYIPAATLFSALCQTWATFYDVESLTDFLDQYNLPNRTLPLMLTSAFPFAQDTYLYPKPLSWRDPEGHYKESKRIQFVSQSIFQEIVSGSKLSFEKENLINGENVWVSADEKEQLKKLMDEDNDEKLDIWKTTTRPRVTIDRQTEESSIWHVQTVQFNKGCGLWFAAKFDSDETKHKIETLLHLLGDNGIGGERNAGYGQFEFTKAECEIPTADGGTQFVTLSPICPKTSEQLEHLLKGDIAYNINTLTGWIGSSGTHKKRKKVSMFAEGSVLNSYDEPVGRLVDLRPDGFRHPVYRYGYAWQVSIKGAPNETEI